VFLGPSGGLAQEMAATMTERDALVAIAFRHYAKEVVAISDVAVARGRRSSPSPIVSCRHWPRMRA
jgi:DNA-binding MurR/RpiR family transcriptional regulator